MRASSFGSRIEQRRYVSCLKTDARFVSRWLGLAASSCNCLNGGSCFGNSCFCLAGFTGASCERVASAPVFGTTLSAGRTTLGPIPAGSTTTGRFYLQLMSTGCRDEMTDRLSCRSLYLGAAPCASSPCLNGGSCFNAGKNFACACRVNFLGQRCERFFQ